ncbi:MAG TPA: universal stress protein [Burkholderiales bacterium]|nr:universal stress protein [Burkholderiales bacterium]
MKYLIPVDSSKAALAPIEHLVAAKRRGAQIEALLLNVQHPFSRRVSELSGEADREALHAERSRSAMASAIELLSRAGIQFRAMTDVGSPAERIAALAESQRVDEILMGVRRHPRWLRWLLPSMPRSIVALTDVPVLVLGRGGVSAAQSYLFWASLAGAAGLAALLLAAD